ncbi:MAG: YgiQ family radical SAM protein [Candidatus Omnitrophota bacterium]
MRFLPTTIEELKHLKRDSFDIILITGDAYVDHPSFGAALIGRLLEHHGFTVGIIAQPDWRSVSDFKKLLRPTLFFGITAGNLDSMLAHYSSNKIPRKTDDYSPGSKSGKRPDRATIVYANRIKELFKDSLIVIGGIEASLRRLCHYDFWQDSLRRSILLDSRADILVYGMGEHQTVEIARRLKNGEPIENLHNIKGTCVARKELNVSEHYIHLPSYEEVKDDKNKFAEAFKIFYQENDPLRGKTLVQKHANIYVIQNPPALPLEQKELDGIYELPFTRRYHPSYENAGGIKALQTVKFSITSHRGCLGSCSFCTIAAHQGRIIQSRSQESILREVKKLTEDKDFKGTITDIGGPTANMYMADCDIQRTYGNCKNKDCLLPAICKNLKLGDRESIKLLKKVRTTPGIKHVFVSTGVRYDLCLADKQLAYLKELCAHHISGQLKVAPEHTEHSILTIMNKPSFKTYEQFLKVYGEINKSLNKKQYLVQYFIASHPGCTLSDMLKLALYIKGLGYYLEQVQDFVPTPMTISSCMYYTGKNPFTMKNVYVPRLREERRMQRALLQFRNKENYRYVYKALMILERNDLVGKENRCLIREK